MPPVIVNYNNAMPVWLVDPATGEAPAGAGDASAANQLAQIEIEEDILAKLSADPATQTTLAAVLAKLSADPATQTTLAAILAAVDGLEVSTDGIEAALALLATAAGQATIIGHVDGIEAALASILAKIIAAPATEAKQDTLIGHVDGLEAVLGTTAGAAVITDANGTAQQYLRGLIVLTLLTNGYLDGVETAIASTNTKLSAGLPAALAASGGLNVQHVAFQFETVAASQTDQPLGGAGAVGDYLDGLLVVPATTSPGAVSIEYGATNITVFAGGASSVLTLHPFFIPIGLNTPSDGGWEITTGANVSIIARGFFSA